MKTKSQPKTKMKAVARSWTVRLTAIIPVALAAAEALKEQLPALGDYLSGWKMVAVSVGVSAVVAALRIRSIAAAFDVRTDNKKGSPDA